jgi:ribosomal protein S19E (S16A)
MLSFVRHHEECIHGVLSGFDRVRFRGTLRGINFAEGLFRYLNFLKVLLVAFKSFFNGTTRRVRLATQRLAKSTPAGKVVYLSGKRDKQEELDELLRKHNIGESFTGLIAIFSSVENCRSFELHKNAGAGKLELQSAFRKCLHYYLYIRDPRFGLMHVRIMSWFPMQVQICLNGREWLARQLDAAGIRYERRDNTFLWVEDFERAQALLDEQQKTEWSSTLSGLLRDYHPELAALQASLHLRDYYWTAEQTEFATDVAFRSEGDLKPLYRRLVRHAMENLSSADVMRFLQQKLTKSGQINGHFKGEVVTDVKTRPEGTRVKHRLGANSLKMYDKFGAVLRIETTIHHAEGLKVYRPKESDPQKKYAWQALRRSVADLHRRCELSRKANEVYLEALAVVECPETLGMLAQSVSQALVKQGRRYRGLNLLKQRDGSWLKAINRGEYAIRGLRNRDLRQIMFGNDRASPDERRRQSGQVTRQLQLLRAHGLIQKVPKSHRYKITEAGRKLATAVSYAEDTSLKAFSQAA